MRIGTSIWADAANVELLKALVADSRSLFVRDIVNEFARRGLSVSKNGVVGKVTRLGLTLAHSVTPEEREARKQRAVARRQKQQASKKPKRLTVYTFGSEAARKPPEPLPPHPSYVPPIEQRVTFMELTRVHCRFVCGQPDGLETVYCGGHVVWGSSYCLPHDRLCRPGAYSAEPARDRRVA